MPRSRLEVLVTQLQGLVGGKQTRSGADTLVWPGGSPLTGTLTVTHGLRGQPSSITFGSASTNLQVAYSNLTATTFDVQGVTIDGTSPAAATARGFSWSASA